MIIETKGGSLSNLTHLTNNRETKADRNRQVCNNLP